VLKTELRAMAPAPSVRGGKERGKLAVIWIDWYAYHVARFRALAEHPALAGRVRGVELVGGTGVHRGLRFRSAIPAELAVDTLFPEGSWGETGKLGIALALWKRLNRIDPAVLLVPGYYTAPGLAAALWGKLHGRRTVLMTESTEGDHRRVGPKEAFKGALIRFLFDWAVAGGTPHRAYLERLGFPGSRIAQFYDVVDNDFFRERSAALRRHSSAAEFDLPERYFLYVGRLAEEKNVVGLLEAYLTYRHEGGDWSLVLAGDGPERPRMEELAARSPFAADIRFAGLRSTAELPEFYAFASAFVLPSTREPWGLVVNEAMASGLPVIVSDRCGCAPDLLREGENGFGFAPQNAGELAACLGAMSRVPEEARARMGRCSAERIEQFSPQAWAAEVARIAEGREAAR
jgi:1,2-diacylglycerol 3-alpha-glucosyltransferase